MTYTVPVEAHTDYLNITLPLGESPGVEEAVLEALRPVFPYPRPKTTELWDIGEHDKQIGTLKMAQLRPVYVVSLSGLALMFIRAQRCLGAFLEVFRHRPHRISRLDAALDVHGLDGAKFIVPLHKRLRRKGIRIGQRRAPLRVYFGDDARGDLTGTLYIGAESARVRYVVYDKRHEQICKGHSDYNAWVRIEGRFRGGDQGVAISLQDVADPTALFWAHLPDGIIDRPAGVPQWGPATDPAGFKLPPRVARDPEDDLARWAQRYGWLGTQLADKCGEHGRRRLAELMQLVSTLHEIPF